MKLSNREIVFTKILLKNNLATYDQVEECIRSFEKESPQSPRPLSLPRLFLTKGFIDKDQMRRVKDATKRTLRILEDIVYGKIAVKHKYTSENRVQECFAIQKAGNYKIKLSELLLIKDYITQRQHKKIRQEQKKLQSKGTRTDLTMDELAAQKENGDSSTRKSFRSIRFGETALKRLLVTSEQVEECLRIQKEMRKRGIKKKLGEVMLQKNYLTEFQVQKIIGAIDEGHSEVGLIESFNIESKLGEGTTGVVYKAYPDKSKTPVALKVLRPIIADDRETLKRFMEEAKKAIRLDHPNIIRAYEVGVSEDYYYYTMEYVPGQTVKNLLEEEDCLELDLAIRIISDIALALEYARENNIIHRDVKPDNIILSQGGGAKLLDLGIAKRLDHDKDLTREGMVMGTPYYISPEVAQGKKKIDHRSDLYSLGATFYRMVTGIVPFDGDTATTVLLHHLTKEPVAPIKLRPELPSELNYLILKLLAKNRSERIQTAGEVLDYLSQFDDGE